jgi:hypothetical protein
MMRTLIVSLTLVACSTAPALGQDAPLDMQPSSAWTADFGENSCSLRRQFAAGEKTMFFELAKLAPGDEARITIASNTLAMAAAEPVLTLQPGNQSLQFDMFEQVTTDAGFSGYIIATPLPDETSPQLSGIALSAGFEQPLVLQTGSLEQAMGVMRDCMDGLLEVWGLDAAEQRSLSREAGFDWQDGWVDGYLSQAEAIAEEYGLGVFRAQLLLDSNGSLSSCYAYQLPEGERRENAVCDYLNENALFEAALNADGNPVASYLHLNIARAGGDRAYLQQPTSRSDQRGIRYPPRDIED